MSKKTSRRAMLTSIIALSLCFAMLVGTTYAWFTDSVSSAGNIIKSGTLKIDVLVKGGDLKTADLDNAGVEKVGEYYSLQSAAEKNTSAPLFNYHLWEPGYTDWANVMVVNKGDLALQYTMRIIPSGQVSALAEVIDVYYAAEEVAKPATRSLAGLTRVGTLKEVLEGGAGVVINDHLLGKDDQGYAPDYATIALHMQESAGNEYQNLEIGSYFDLQIIATQYTYEVDSFDDQYDAQAVYPDVATVTVPANAAATTITAGAVTVAVPANAGTDAQVYRLDVSNADTTTDATTNETSVEFDATLYLNNVKVTSDNNENIYVLTLTLPAGATISSVTHNGNVLAAATTGADQTYTYDPTTGVLTIYTKSFSPFAVVYTRPIPDIANVAAELSVDNIIISSEHELLAPTVKSTYAVVSTNNTTLKDLNIKGNSNAANGALTLNGSGNIVTDVVINQVDGSGSTLILKGGSGIYTVKNSTLTHGTSATAGRYGALYFEGATINDQAAAQATVTTVDNVKIGLAYDREAMIEKYVAMGASREQLEAALPEDPHDLGMYLSLFSQSGGLIYRNFGGMLNVTNSVIDTPYYALKVGIDAEPRYGWVNVTDSTINTTNIGFERVDYTTFKNVTFKNEWKNSSMQISTGSSYQGNLNYIFEDCTFDLSGLNIYLSSTGADSVHNPKMTFKNCTLNGVAITADNYSTVIGAFLTFSTNQSNYTGQIQNLAFDAETSTATFTVARVAK